MDDLGLGFCFTLALVRGLDPDQVLARLGGPEPVDITGSELLVPAADIGVTLPDPDTWDERVDTGLTFLGATSAGDWTLVVGPGLVLWSRELAVAMPEAVLFSYHEYASHRFWWTRDGVVLAGFDPSWPRDVDLLHDALVSAGFQLDDHNSDVQDLTLALCERMTGVSVTPSFLAGADYRCAAVPGGSQTSPYLDEVRELLADYAADPAAHNVQDRFEWERRGVTDGRVRATGHSGLRLFDRDQDLLRAIVYAPEELRERMLRQLPAGGRYATTLIMRIDVNATADIWRRFPELADVEIPAQPPERERARRWRETRARIRAERDAEHHRRQEERDAGRETAAWGGRVPDSDRLRSSVWGRSLAGIDRDLVDEIAIAGPERQRAMAGWAARYACERAGLLDQDWAVEAVEALERGEPEPASFTDGMGPVTDHVFVTTLSDGAGPLMPPLSPAGLALSVLTIARDEDTLDATLNAVYYAVQLRPDDRTAAVAAFRSAFPAG